MYNVPRRYITDDVYEHLRYLDIKATDLSQTSHPDAKKKSFIVTIDK